MTKKKFTTSDIAKQFISEETPQEQAPTTTAGESVGQFVYVKPARETKKIRFQLVLKPSTADKLRKAAANSDTSMNDLIGQLIDTYL